MFYLWLVCEFGYDRWVSYRDMEPYASKRHIYRLVKVLFEEKLLRSKNNDDGRRIVKPVQI